MEIADCPGMPETDPDTPIRTAESDLWTGHPSQWVHFWFYLFCVLLVVGAVAAAPWTGGLSAFALVIPVLFWGIRWWATRTTVYVLTSQRLRILSGILTRRLDELELYRVKDYVLEQPLLLRLVGLGNLTLVTSDATTPTVTLRAIGGVEEVRELLRNAVQRERDRKRVRELDVGAHDDSPGH